MRIKNLPKRIVCMFLALLMVVTAVPANGFIPTAHAAQYEGLCEHHTAHDACGYIAAAEEQPCQHVHDEQCGYEEGTEDSCLHTHDAQCGYREGTEGQPCGYVCEDCKAEAALKHATELFAELPDADSVTADMTEAQKDAVFAQLEAAMNAYDGLWENYPEQAAAFEETNLEQIQNALDLNDALIGNVAQTYAHQKYNAASKSNVTITLIDEGGNRITGATITVSSGKDTYEVVEVGNGQYKFTKKNGNTTNYTVNISATGFEDKTQQIAWWDSSANITLENTGDLSTENLKTFKVFYIATGELPSSYAGAGDASDYGPSGNNTPLVLITVDINKLREEYASVVQYKENTSSNHWEFTPKGAAQNMAATEAFWAAVWACMTPESKAAFAETGFANDFYGYVLKQQKNGSSQHCDGILTKEPPVYVIELYQNDTYFGGSVTDKGDSFKTVADVQQMYEAHLGADVTWSSNTVGTFFSGSQIYTVKITQTNAGSAKKITGSEIPYESKNSTNTYYLAKFNLVVTEGAEGYYGVTYTDGVDSEDIFDNQMKAVKSGSKVPAFEGTPQRGGYLFKGWMEESSGNILTDAQISAMTVSADLTFHAVWEAIPTSFTGTVNVLLNDSYPVDISAMMDANTKLYVSKTSGSYTQLDRSATGVYAAELENGTWYVYYSNDGANYTKVDEGALVINNAPASRALHFYSVSYELDGGTAVPQIPVAYYIDDAQVKVTATVPTKAGYRFTGWKTGETVYQPESILTGSIAMPYTLVAQWEKTVSVTVNVNIDHTDGVGYDVESTKDDVYLELVSRANDDAAYLETGHDLTLNKTSHAGYTYTPTYGLDNSDEEVRQTNYTANGATFTDMPGGTVDYSVVISKSGYDATVVATQDANGNWIIDVQLKFDPINFDLEFTVDVADSVPAALIPAAAIVKVTCWDGAQWDVISQHAGSNPGVRVNIDPSTHSGSGSYPVWREKSGSSELYGYRIKVSAFVYPNGTIVPASLVVTPDVEWTDNVYVATAADVTGGKAFGSLNGAYYDAGTHAQKGKLHAQISMDLHKVIFDAKGGTVNGLAKQTVEDQYRIPALSNYTPVRDGGYIFEGWYTKDGTTTGDWGDAAIGGTDLTGDVTLYAKWREPVSVTGSVYVAGSYQLDGNTHIIHDVDRAKTVLLLLRKQGEDGVFRTATVNVTYGADHMGTGTYTFDGLADDGTVYYIEERAANYSGLYLNEPQSLTVTTDFTQYTAANNIALLNGDKVAVVNAYLPFDPASFDLKYSVDATAIGAEFGPTAVEMLVTYDADHTITNPANWPVISQMVTGATYSGDVLSLSEGRGAGSTSVWSSFSNGTTLYDYGIRVANVTGAKLTGYGSAPYTITYQAPAHQVSGGQSKALIATLTPNQYDITYELGVESIAVTGMSIAPGKHTWSYDTDLSAVRPVRTGYQFLGWYDNASFSGNPVTEIDAAVAENVTLYAKWYQMMDDVDLTVTIIHKSLDGNGEAGNYDKNLLVQLTGAKDGSSIYEDVVGKRKSYGKNIWHTLGDDADEETLQVPKIFTGLPYDYAYNLNVSLDGYYVTEKTVTPVEDPLTGATTYQVAVTLRYNPDLLTFTFGAEMAPGIDKSLWPESAEVKVSSWYDPPSAEIGLDWNTITQHESGSVTVELDSTGKGTGSYPVWQWLDKSQGKPYYYRIEVISLHMSDGSILLTNGTGSEKDVVYSGGDYSATVETTNCVVPSGSVLAGAYGQDVSGTYVQVGEVKAVISIDRWKDEPDAETGGDGTDDHQQALVLLRSADETKGTVSGAVRQVFTLEQQADGNYSKVITPEAVTAAANTAAGYVLSHWTNAAGETVDPFQAQTVRGGQTYVYTANWKYNENLSYKVKYLNKDTLQPVAAEKTVGNITYGSTVAAADEVIAISGYVFDYAANASITVGMGENVLTLYYAVDKLDDVDNNETDGDGIADYKQAVIKFVSGDNGTVSGETTQVITLTKQTGGTYTGSVIPEAVTITPKTYYTFDQWKLPNGTGVAEENAPYADANKLTAEGGKTYTYTVTWKAQTYSYQVRYLDKETHTAIAPEITKSFVYDGTVQTESAIAITGYHLAAGESSSRTLAYAAGQIITFYYTKNTYDLTVHFVDMDTDPAVKLHEDVTVKNLPYLAEPSIAVLQNLAEIPGYSYVEAAPASVTIKDPSEQGNKPNEITLKYRKNTYDLTVQYYYDGVLDNTKTEIVTGIAYNTMISTVWSHTGAAVKSGTDYVLERITGQDIAISDQEALNAVHVYYLSDKLTDNTNGEDNQQTDGTGDGIPDVYQATVTYHIINGTWQGQTELEVSYVFTLYQQGTDGKWTKLPAPTLGTTIPKGIPDSGFADPGAWSPVAPAATTQVVGNADYILAYTDADTHAIIVTVVNGSAAVDGTPEAKTHFVRMVKDEDFAADDIDKTLLTFTPNAGHMLWSVTVDGTQLPAPALTDGKYHYTVAHEADHNIVVVFEKDTVGEDKDNDGNTNEPDGIPDKYQKKINYRIVNGTWDGTDAADKQIYVTLKAGDQYDVNGTAQITDPYLSTKKPNAGYTTSGSWVDDVAQSVSFPMTVSGLQDETFIFGYHEKQKVTVTIEVEGGTSLPKPSTTVYEYTTAKTTIQFTGDADHVLASATVNGTAVTLTDETYTHDYTKDLHIKVVYKLDQWNEPGNSETGGDTIPDEQQALVQFKAGANGSVSGATTQVYTLTADGSGKYVADVMLEKVSATPQDGYRLLYWQDTAGHTYTDAELFAAAQHLEGDKQYVFTAIFGKDVFSYTVAYYFDGVLDTTKTETVNNVVLDTQITLHPANRTGDRYMLEKVAPATLNITHISANNVIKVYYVTDQLDGENGKETGGDHIPDYQQALIRFVSDGNGTVSGKTVQVFNLTKSGSSYSGIVVPTAVTATPNTGYKFSRWEKADKESDPYVPTTLSGGQEITYTARFVKDSFSYSVQTYYDGVLTKTEPGAKVEVGSVVTVDPALRDGDYMLEKVEPASKSLQISTVEEENVIRIYYVKDIWDDGAPGEEDNETDGDGIPDSQQVLVSFVPGDSNGTVTGAGATQVFTFGAGVTSADVTPVLTDVTVKGNQGYAFDHWTKDNLLQPVNPAATLVDVPGGTAVLFKAHFAGDTLKDAEKTPDEDTDDQTGGDNIPDKYQAVITYMVENGTWSDGTDEAINEIFTLYSWDPVDCCWIKLSVPLGNTVPQGMKPAAGYTAPGHWEKADTTADDPVAQTWVTENATYTYWYGQREQFTITVTVENGQATPDQSTILVTYGEDQTISFQPDEGYALDSVTVDGAAAVLTDGAYSFTDVVADHSIHVVYGKDSWKDSQQTPEEDTDGEDGGDGIPDYRQAMIAFAADQNGTIEGTTLYVVTLAQNNGEYKGQFSAKKEEVSAKANEGYKFDKWTLTKDLMTRQMPTEAVDPYAPMEVLGGYYYLYRAQFTEDMRDVTYPEADPNGSTPEDTDVSVLFAKYIQVRPNGGSWNNSMEDQTVQITEDYILEDPVRAGYLFMGWERTEATEENVAYVFTAQWEVDEVGKTDEDGTDMPDSIPDKYQKKIVFKVVNGHWQEGTDADKVLWLTLVDENGNWAEDGSAVLETPTGMYAKSGYENGKWDTTPPETVSGTDSETFTYRFSRIPVNENVPDTGDASAKTVLICVTAMTVSAAALMLMLVAYYRDKKRRTR